MESRYTIWRKSLYERDGPDNSIIDEARGEDRLTLENELISNLGPSEAVALARMGAKRALPAIERLRESSRGSKRATFSYALMRLTGNTDCIEDITSVLCPPKWIGYWNHVSLWNCFTFSDRIEAAHFLEDCLDPRAFDALEKAMYDPDFLVRCNAATVFSRNSAYKTEYNFIVHETKDNDKNRIRSLIQILRSRISEKQQAEQAGTCDAEEAV